MKLAAFLGFLIWLVATIALRLFGQYVFRDTSTQTAVILLAVSAPLMALLAWVILRKMEQRALAAIALVVPGMLFDTATTIWFSRVFPNIRPDAAGLFGGWLLFCNMVVLVTAIALQARPRSVNSPGLLQ